MVGGGRAKGKYPKKRLTSPAPSGPHLGAVSLPGCGRAEGGLLEGLSGLTQAGWKKALAEGAQRDVYLGLDPYLPQAFESFPLPWRGSLHGRVEAPQPKRFAPALGRKSGAGLARTAHLLPIPSPPGGKSRGQ